MHLDQRRRVDPDLVGEVAQRGAPGQPDDLAVAARDRDAANRRRLHVVELLAPLLLRLPAARRPSARAAERALGAAPAAAAAARPRGPDTGARRSAARAAAASSRAAAARPGTDSGTAGAATWAATAGERPRRHAARTRPRAAWPLTARPAGVTGTARSRPAHRARAGLGPPVGPGAPGRPAAWPGAAPGWADVPAEPG